MKSASGMVANVTLKFLCVSDNHFEVPVHFIGYGSLSSNGLMKALKYLGCISVQFETNENAVLSARIAAAFMDLFMGRLRHL